MLVFNCIFGLIALIVSGWFGWNATYIWPQPKPQETNEQLKKRQETAQRIYQIWFNFAGSIVGWFVLWVLIRRYWPHFSEASAVCLGWWDLLGAFIAFAGITGHLPWTVVAIISSLDLFGRKVASQLIKA